MTFFRASGAFSLGLERSGAFKTVAFCEIEPFPRRVLAKHWPEVPIYDDVRTLTADRLAADGIAVDAICGGFPCQDISFAGKGVGLAGERSGLWYEYARLIGELGPKFVIVENVGALLSRGLDAVLGSLASLGYDSEWDCIPAGAVGSIHQRDRVWILAYPRQEREQRVFPKAVSRQPAFSWCENVRGIEDIRGRSNLPPSIFRGACDGVPDWMDRLASLGNAVVPQVVELIGRAIAASLETTDAA